jgi:hypothetical protein
MTNSLSDSSNIAYADTLDIGDCVAYYKHIRVAVESC